MRPVSQLGENKLFHCQYYKTAGGGHAAAVWLGARNPCSAAAAGGPAAGRPASRLDHLEIHGGSLDASAFQDCPPLPNLAVLELVA
jgi:hypothetical protein